jgi:hypothetical protein
MRTYPRRGALDAALERRPGDEYEEGAFHYFLAIERSRARHSNQALRLLLVTVEPVPGRPVHMGRPTAARLFAGLRLSLRETDVTGWFRQDRVAAAVLSVRADASASQVSSVIQRRVGEGVRRRLPSEFACGLRLRLVPLLGGPATQRG